VAARYARPQLEPFRAGAWLGKAVLLVLAGLLLTGYVAMPVAVFTV
jgi:hypothetical protein